MSWPTVALADLGKVNTGSTPKTTDPTMWGGETPFVTPSELGSSEPITSAHRCLTAEGVASSRLAPEGAVLVCCIGSLGKTGIAGRALVTNQQINWIDFDKRVIFPRFGYYACELLGRTLADNSASTTIPIINKSRFSQLKIPVPPLDEQRGIATILDKADTLRRKRERAIELLDGLTQSIFVERFGDLGSATQQERLVPLSGLVRVVGGYAFKSEHFATSGDPIVRISDLDGEIVSFSAVARILDANVGKGRKFQVYPGDLLIAMSGTTGKTGLVPPNAPQPTYLNQRVGRYVIERSDMIHREYLLSLVRSNYYQTKVQEMARGAAQPNISADQLTSIAVPLPSIAAQEDFSVIAQQVRSARAVHLTAHARLDECFKVIQNRAFSGQL